MDAVAKTAKEIARLARKAANLRRWKQRHPEKVNANSLKYYTEHAAEIMERRKKGQVKYAARIRAYHADRYRLAKERMAADPEFATQERKRKCEISKRYARNHPDLVRERQAKYRAANAEAVKARTYARERTPQARIRQAAAYHRRRARLAAVVSTLTASEWTAILAVSPACTYCQQPFTEALRPTMDHVIPIKLGGPHSKDNVVAACKRCNSLKQARTPEQWRGISRAA